MYHHTYRLLLDRHAILIEMPLVRGKEEQRTPLDPSHAGLTT